MQSESIRNGHLPDTLFLVLADLRLFMIHDMCHLPSSEQERAHLIIYDHSHRPEIREISGTIYLNPGNAGPRRFRLPVTLAILDWVRGDEKPEPWLIHLLLNRRIISQINKLES